MELDKYQEAEKLSEFIKRKKDHVNIALQDNVQAIGLGGFDSIQVLHEALPEIDYRETNLSVRLLGKTRPTPFLISSMTAGHDDSKKINTILARASAERGWLMGVGSQRRELSDETAIQEWSEVRIASPKVSLLGNLGLAQLIKTPTSQILRLVEALQAEAMIIHLNALQEALQMEGEPNFKGGLKAIERLCKELPVPVVVKETGCGISARTATRLSELGVAAIDVSGLGGTHWGRVEGQRSALKKTSKNLAEAAEAFANWGIPTVAALKQVVDCKLNSEVWASGGVRNGLDAFKLLVMGAKAIGIAKPILESALVGEETLLDKMQTFEFECRVAMFCTGQVNLAGIDQKGLLQWPTV